MLKKCLIWAILALTFAARGQALTLSVPRAAYDLYQPILSPPAISIDIGETRVFYTFEGDAFESAILAPLWLKADAFESNLQGTFVESENTFYLDVPAMYEDIALCYALRPFETSEIDAALSALSASLVKDWEGRKSIYIERVHYLDSLKQGYVTEKQVRRADMLYKRCHSVTAADGTVLAIADEGASRMRWFAQLVLRPIDSEAARTLEEAAASAGFSIRALYSIDLTNRKSAKDVEKKLAMVKLDAPPEQVDLSTPYNIDGFRLTISGEIAKRADQALLLTKDGEVVKLERLASAENEAVFALPELGSIAIG